MFYGAERKGRREEVGSVSVAWNVSSWSDVHFVYAFFSFCSCAICLASVAMAVRRNLGRSAETPFLIAFTV